LKEKLEKSLSNSTLKSQIDSDQIKQLQKELNTSQKRNKDLKLEITNIEQKLLVKDNEIKEHKKRLETKFNIDDKTKERDSCIFNKFLGNITYLIVFRQKADLHQQSRLEAGYNP
jgi:predicted  nucleic acid-binding Zn-ribbon protein